MKSDKLAALLEQYALLLKDLDRAGDGECLRQLAKLLRRHPALTVAQFSDRIDKGRESKIGS